MIAGVITGGGLINSGVHRVTTSKHDNQVINDTANIIRFANVRIIVGAAIIVVSVLVFATLTIFICRKVRRLRIIYEKAVFETISNFNKELRSLEIRWKIGIHLRWVEISFDRKKKAYLEGKHEDEKNEEGDKPHFSNECDPTNVQVSVQ